MVAAPLRVVLSRALAAAPRRALGATAARALATPAKAAAAAAVDPLQRLRNIGIIAHIDAGKVSAAGSSSWGHC